MKVLVTGAGGFIGSHLAEYLVSQGHSIRAFVRYNSSSSSGWLDTSSLAGEMEIIRGDIRDFDSVKSAVSGTEAVFHLAALIGIPYSYVSPLAYIRTNMEGSYNILQAARECDVRRVVHTSNSEIYGTAQRVPIDEKHPVNPQSPYAASKSAADQLALSYYRSFALPVTVVRPFNTYGPRQSARAIIPTIASQLAFGQKVLRLGNLTPTRDLNFVEDIYGVSASDRDERIKKYADAFEMTPRLNDLIGSCSHGMKQKIALISALNALFAAVLGISFQGILGYIFYPVAWVMGVPASEALQVGSIMATKLVSNEFVAMMDLQKIASTLSPRAEGIISIFLVSFANFSSIGIIAGAIKGLNEEQGNVVSRFGLKLVYGSTLVSVLSASIAALVL